MNKNILTLLTTSALAAISTTSLRAQVILFDGSTDTIFKATADNPNVSLTNSSGNITLTNNSTAANIGAQIFGNFANTTLSNVGDYIRLSFTINNIPNSSNTPLTMSLSGLRAGTLKTSDVAYSSFERSYAGFRVTQAISSASVNYHAWNGGPASNTSTDRNILAGATSTALGSNSTGTGANRFDAGDTADITFSVVRDSATAFRIDYILNVVGGTGDQIFSSSNFVPTGDYFQLGNAFTTFAIGFHNTMDNGSALNITNLTVSTIPEPTTWALLAGSLTALVIFRRRRRA